MNSYYHEVSVGPNFWMIYIIVMVGAMILLGLMQHRWHTHYRTRQTFGNSLFSVVAIIAGIILAIWLMIESSDGIIQMLDNNIPGDAYAWQSVIGAPLVTMIVGFIFGSALYALGRIVSMTKLGWLRLRMKDNRCAQMHWREARQLTRRQGTRYKRVKPDYLRSVTTTQMVEHKGNRAHRMRIMCDDDYITLEREQKLTPHPRKQSSHQRQTPQSRPHR